MKYVTIFFDLEGFWEAPYKGSFDEELNTINILDILDKYKAKGVFNTCGIIGEFYPDLIKKLDKEGHEIASHGYMHENFNQLTKEELHKILEKTEKALNPLTKNKIIGLRSPWLQSSDIVYEVAGERGYKWISNQHTPFPELFSNPGSKNVGVYRLAKLSLKLQHMFTNLSPYRKDKILEIPISSSLENDLLGLMNYWQQSPKKWMDYAYDSLLKQFSRSGKYFNLNFHPWIIGSANRPLLLDKILGYISSQDIKFILARDIAQSFASDK